MKLSENQKKIWSRLRYWLGYLLFAGAVIYSLYQAPEIFWQLKPLWLIATIAVILLMLVVEIGQFFIFLDYHQIRSRFVVPLQFSVRKAILNAVLPAKTGTLLFLHLITDTYKLEWHNYIRFMIVATIIMLVVSGLAVASVLLPLWAFLLILGAAFLFSWILSRWLHGSYWKQTPSLLLVGGGLYVCRIFIFWTILMATGYGVTFEEASYFAIATNTLAQIPLTPGNVGVREVIFGFMSPYLSLPMSVGVLVGAIFQVLRIIVYAVVMVVVDLLHDKEEVDALISSKPN